MLLNIDTSSAIFVDLLLKYFDRKNNMQTIFTETPGEEISPIGKCIPIIKKRGNQLKYFQAPQSSYRNYVSLVFSTSTRRRNLVQMPIISGDK